MKPSSFLQVAALSLVICPAMAQDTDTPPAANTPAATMFEKVTLEVDGKSKSNGTITVAFTAANGKSKSVSVNVLSKTKDKKIAEDLWKEVKIAAGDRYKVKQNGSKISIKKADKEAPDFSVQVTANVAGISVLVS